MNLLTTIVAASIASGTCYADTSMESMRIAETKEMIREVLAESATHTSLRHGVQRDFTFTPTGFVQFRYLYNDGNDLDVRQGFDVRKAAFGFKGRLQLGEGFANYKVTAEVGANTDFRLRDAYISNDFGFATVKVGQFKTQFMSEVNVSTPDTLIGDYSIVSYTFGQGRSQGVELSKELGDFNLSGAYTDGFNSNNTEVTTQHDYGFVGRLAYGGLDWVDLGAAIAYNEAADEGVTSYTFDATFDLGDDLTSTVGYVARDGDFDGWGVVGQVGYKVASDCQLFGMYEYGKIDSEVLNIATVGVNYDLCTNVRWTNSVGYSFEGVGSSWDVNDTGWSNNSEDGQYLVRSQITFSF